MIVAHCIDGLGIGGAQRSIESIVRSLEGPTLRSVVYTNSDGLFRANLEEAGAVVRILPRLLARIDPILVRKLARTMANDRVDVVHTHLFGDTLHGYLAARVAGEIPVVATLHSPVEAGTWLRQAGYRWLLPRLSASVATTPSVRDHFASLAGASAASIELIYNGVEDRAESIDREDARRALRTSLGLSQSTTLVGSVGRLVEEKGYEHLVRSFARLRGPATEDSRLVLVGDGPLRGTLEALARELGLENRVCFLGQQRDIFPLLCAFDLFVSSSIREGFPLALLEAMSARCPIVVTDIPAHRDALDEGRSASFVAPGDAQALSTGIERVLGDSTLAETIASGARSRFVREFTAAQMGTQYLRIYERLYDENRLCNVVPATGSHAPRRT